MKKTTTDRAFQLSLSGHRAPVDYDRAPTYVGMITEKDVLVPMRDGIKIAADVYRPETTEKAPGPAGLLDSQQGPARSRTGPGLAHPSGLVDAVDRSGGSGRYALLRRPRLRPRDR